MPYLVRKTGVYKIYNRISKKVYVGSASFCLCNRANTHRSLLNAGTHGNRYLQRAWVKYGPDAFIFSVLVECPPEDCLRKEQEFIDKFRSTDPRYGYNIAPVAGNSRGVKTPISHREKTSAALRLRITKPETRRKRSESLMGHAVSPETRKKISEKRKGIPLSAEHRTKIGQRSREWWSKNKRIFSPEAIEKMRKAAKEREQRKREKTQKQL